LVNVYDKKTMKYLSLSVYVQKTLSLSYFLEAIHTRAATPTTPIATAPPIMAAVCCLSVIVAGAVGATMTVRGSLRQNPLEMGAYAGALQVP